MKFTKPALTIEQQVELLLSRGMLGNREEMKQRLTAVSYYRLSGYWFHRKRSDDTFEPGTNFGVVWDQYVFDRKLRILVMDALERIEVGLRTQFSYQHAHAHGPFGYVEDPGALPKLKADARDRLLLRISDEVDRSKERTPSCSGCTPLGLEGQHHLEIAAPESNHRVLEFMSAGTQGVDQVRILPLRVEPKHQAAFTDLLPHLIGKGAAGNLVGSGRRGKTGADYQTCLSLRPNRAATRGRLST